MTVQAVPDPEATAKLFEEQRPPLQVDERDPDQLEVAITGTVKLDRTNEQHVRLFSGLRIGRHLDCVVAAVVTAQPRRAKFDGDGNVEDHILRATLKAEDITLATDE